MASHNESNDTSDLFWPGYVDAISNLAINLLFVIAVMSIVVIGVTLQIAQMTKKKAIEEAQSQQTAIAASTTQDAQKNEAAKDADSKDPAVTQLQQTINEFQKKLEKTQKQLKEAEAKLSAADVLPLPVVRAIQNKPSDTGSPNKVQAINQAAVMVVFNPEVVTMAASEVNELVEKLKTISPLGTGRWEISVISPKGFSEAQRLAFYRANAARNALLENGVSSQAIDMKINESVQAAADNSKVLVRWFP